ncbi:MAG: glucosamine-6-phosphate deaminase [Firmicutes bacterium HGW-Firmicutes-7]|nr:MAG: glucosamine-6-phosphate deaminase [Firmicutes bacterium HGW-Firmicutes-7]
MTIYITESYEEMSKKTASIVLAQVTIKPNSILGLATGGTPIGLYKEMVYGYKSNGVDFSQVKTFNLDEYFPIKKDNEQSYAYYMNEKLFNHINISSENIHIPNGENVNTKEECESYNEQIYSCGGIDLQVLGIGNNGHIGFNEPDVSFEARTHLVNLDQETIEANARFFESEEEVPRQAISMGIGNIMHSRKILLIASGKSKANIISKTLFGDISPNVPASILQLHNDVTVVLDQEAAEEILQREELQEYIR